MDLGWNNHEIKTVFLWMWKILQFSSPKIRIVFPEHKLSKRNNKKDYNENWSKAIKK